MLGEHIVTRIVSYLNTRDRGLFLDVGANVGAFTATVAANDNGVAVEPFRLNVRPPASAATARRDPRPSQVPLIRRTMCGPALGDRVSPTRWGSRTRSGPMCIWSTNDEINRGNARMTPYFEGRRDFGQDKQKADDAPVACGCGLDGDWPEAPSKAPPDWLRVPRQSSAWAVTMVLALPACRGAPARSLREASACGPRDACVFDALKRSGDRCACAAKRLLRVVATAA
ncbi:hypothetical protein JL720_17126 [Aureococcus anophagefferens]|nr:hypothetical protein JL720_17126 [Aureococcus anophagefferens]